MIFRSLVKFGFLRSNDAKLKVERTVVCTGLFKIVSACLFAKTLHDVLSKWVHASTRYDALYSWLVLFAHIDRSWPKNFVNIEYCHFDKFV